MKNIGASEALIFTKGLKMLKQRKAAAEQLAARLFETEFAMDEAIIKMAELVSFMPVARNKANLSAVVGQDAIVQASQALAAFVEARGHLVETHKRLGEARDQIGLREMALGTQNDKPQILPGKHILEVVDRVA
ncbi:hypothetical protein [Parasphingorhabdus sp.]|jgi:hypothetical protein|uniref:hypothetical protein n=1 Tax=Parasphingorhabdus sp. TaxID=2709688 RepID=UPI003D2B623D